MQGAVFRCNARYDVVMDERVLAAMARWPDVPDVFGWLSLNAGGHWRLHPEGDALADLGAGSPLREGLPISSTRINQFINRNYARDTVGRWYFQNGPQRVYVRLDVAPYVLHTTGPEPDVPAFLTHNGLRIDTVIRWCLDDQGYLYADTDHGAGLIASRDLAQLMERLVTVHGDSVFDVLQGREPADVSSVDVRLGAGPAVPLYLCKFEQVAELLGFARYPRPG